MEEGTDGFSGSMGSPSYKEGSAFLSSKDESEFLRRIVVFLWVCVDSAERDLSSYRGSVSFCSSE